MRNGSFLPTVWNCASVLAHGLSADMASLVQWLYGTRSGRVATAMMGCVFAMSAGFYTTSQALPIYYRCVRAIKARGSTLQKSGNGPVAKDNEIDKVHCPEQIQDSDIEGSVEIYKSKKAEQDILCENLDETAKSSKQAVEPELQGAGMIESKRKNDDLDYKSSNLDTTSTTADLTLRTREIKAARLPGAIIRFEEKNLLLEEEVKDLRADILYQADEHEKKLAALQAQFFIEYGVIESEMETLGQANQVLCGEVAQANAAVEGLKMQMTTAAETAEAAKLDMMKKLEDEQAEYNKLEDDRDYLQEDKDALLKEIEGLKEDQHGLQQERDELAKQLSSLEDRDVESEQSLAECSPQLTSVTEELAELGHEIDEWTKLTEVKEHPKNTAEPEKVDALIDHMQSREDQVLGSIYDGTGAGSTAFDSGTPSGEEWTPKNQETCNYGVDFGGQPSLVFRDSGFVDDNKTVDKHHQSGNRLLIAFREKVEEILQALAEGTETSTTSHIETTLFTLVKDLENTLRQMPLAREGGSYGDDTLIDDTPDLSTTDLAVDDQSCPDEKATRSIKAPSEYDDDAWEQRLQGPSSFSDVVEECLPLSHRKQRNRALPPSNTNLVEAQRLLSDELQDQPTEPKMTRWKRFSHRSRSLMGGLHNSATPSDHGKR